MFRSRAPRSAAAAALSVALIAAFMVGTTSAATNQQGSDRVAPAAPKPKPSPTPTPTPVPTPTPTPSPTPNTNRDHLLRRSGNGPGRQPKARPVCRDDRWRVRVRRDRAERRQPDPDASEAGIRRWRRAGWAHPGLACRPARPSSTSTFPASHACQERLRRPPRASLVTCRTSSPATSSRRRSRSRPDRTRCQTARSGHPSRSPRRSATRAPTANTVFASAPIVDPAPQLKLQCDVQALQPGSDAHDEHQPSCERPSGDDPDGAWSAGRRDQHRRDE